MPSKAYRRTRFVGRIDPNVILQVLPDARQIMCDRYPQMPEVGGAAYTGVHEQRWAVNSPAAEDHLSACARLNSALPPAVFDTHRFTVVEYEPGRSGVRHDCEVGSLHSRSQKSGCGAVAPATAHRKIMEANALELRTVEVVGQFNAGGLAGRDIRIIKNTSRRRALDC
jgi:hypothetical protein